MTEHQSESSWWSRQWRNSCFSTFFPLEFWHWYKGIVHSKKKVSLFVEKFFCIFFSRTDLEKYIITSLANSSSVVNGCCQNETPNSWLKNITLIHKSISPVVSHIEIHPHICLELFWFVNRAWYMHISLLIQTRQPFHCESYIMDRGLF